MCVVGMELQDFFGGGCAVIWQSCIYTRTVRLLGSRTVLVIFKLIFSVRRKLLSDTEFFLGDDGTVAVDVLADQVVEKTTTLTYQSLECSCGRIIFMI